MDTETILWFDVEDGRDIFVPTRSIVSVEVDARANTIVHLTDGNSYNISHVGKDVADILGKVVRPTNPNNEDN